MPLNGEVKRFIKRFGAVGAFVFVLWRAGVMNGYGVGVSYCTDSGELLFIVRYRGYCRLLYGYIAIVV